MTTPLVRVLVALVAVALLMPAAVADVAVPRTTAPAEPAARANVRAAPAHASTMVTRWPSVLPCPRPDHMEISRAYDEDVLAWSNRSGDRVTQDGTRPLPPGFLRDPPRSLAWTPHGPEKLAGPAKRSLRERFVVLSVTCGDDPSPALGEMLWDCQVGQASCPLQVTYPEPDPDVLRRYSEGERRARVRQVMQAGANARDLLIADALQLIRDACADNRCSDLVTRAVPRLRAAAAEPPWKVSRPNEHRLELTAPGASGDKVSCSDKSLQKQFNDEDCKLTLGSFSFDTGRGALDSDSWWLDGNEDGYSFVGEAAR